jgi:hypothetical protein
LNVGRAGHTATLLTNGLVLVVGGQSGDFSTVTNSVELYDPSSGTWTTTNSLHTGRYQHTASLLPNGQVFVAGGIDNSLNVLSSAELFNPVTGTWTQINVLKTVRTAHTANLLPNGKVLLAGGQNNSTYISSAELYDPMTGTNTTTATLNTARAQHTATMLANGKVLVTGGQGGLGATNSTEVYDYANGTNTLTGSLNTARAQHMATLLPNGKVLIAGGQHVLFGYATNSAELYDPSNGTWTATGSMTTNRGRHTATLLPSGKVLVAGGYSSGFYAFSGAELYDPATGIWTSTGAMTTNRENHTATLLSNGKVLVTGGDSSPAINGDVYNALSSAELYDPVTGIWTPTGAMATNRTYQTSTRLTNGKVLVTGGANRNIINSSGAELYDPVSGTWTLTGTMTANRAYHTTTLLPNGKVLGVGGRIGKNNSAVPVSAELYDPVSGTWRVTSLSNTNRENHTATLLPNGKVLVAGGDNNSSPDRGGTSLSSVELFDPAIGTWITNRALNVAREYHTATLLPNGKILIAAGYGNVSPYTFSSAELYDVGLGYSNTAQPQIASLISPLNLGDNLVVTGRQFRGVSEGSSGNTQDSSADYPLVQLRSIESGQTVFLLSTNWSTNSFASSAVWNFPPGWALATVFVNGIQSTSSIVNISVPVPTTTTLNRTALTNGKFQFSFTNSAGALFGVLATTNLLLPLTNWTKLGGVVEISSGQFQFTDPQATNGGQRYYNIFVP